jgi:hypothetical protein
MGLERKRQKRKEKFWRQHCRKAAKEYAERKPVPGRGATRMKELGLECAERNRGYGIPGQSTQLVISLWTMGWIFFVDTPFGLRPLFLFEVASAAASYMAA